MLRERKWETKKTWKINKSIDDCAKYELEIKWLIRIVSLIDNASDSARQVQSFISKTQVQFKGDKNEKEKKEKEMWGEKNKNADKNLKREKK